MMNYIGKALLYGFVFALIAGLLALTAVVRLAAGDPARWHVLIADGNTASPGPCAGRIRKVHNGARATCLLSGTPSEILTRLDAIALATPRTQHLAGSPAEFRITWIGRTFIMGYPDYITAEATQLPDGTRLDIYARQRYGDGDWGVNAARLRDWLTEL